MGTYILRMASISSKTSKWTGYNTASFPGVCNATDANLVEAANNTTSANLTQSRFCDVLETTIGSHLIRFGAIQGDLVWYLDGSGTPISFNSLPAGFFIQTAVFKVAKDGSTHYYGNASSH